VNDDKPSSPRQTRSNLSVVPAGKKGGTLAAIRAGKAVVAKSPDGSKATLLQAALDPARRARLVFALDATASREAAWEAARHVTDALFEALPGQLDVSLAVHGGSALHTFTDFVSDPARLRQRASTVRCIAGTTKLVEILERTRQHSNVRVLLYVGDTFEEDPSEASRAADALRVRGCRVIVLHDRSGGVAPTSTVVFEDIARRTQGAVLPFDASSPARLRQILEAVGALAAGGVRLLRERSTSLPGATLLLEHLNAGSA
jgi:hypothetical protein